MKQPGYDTRCFMARCYRFDAWGARKSISYPWLRIFMLSNQSRRHRFTSGLLTVLSVQQASYRTFAQVPRVDLGNGQGHALSFRQCCLHDGNWMCLVARRMARR